MDLFSINNEQAKRIPIACRYVAYDQWLITHLHPSWKIEHIKLFILSKCLGALHVPLPDSMTPGGGRAGGGGDAPRRQPSPITFAPRPSSRRPASPLMFASPPSATAGKKTGVRTRKRSATLDAADDRIRAGKGSEATQWVRSASPSSLSSNVAAAEYSEREDVLNRGYEEDDEYNSDTEDEDFAAGCFAPRTYRPSTASTIVAPVPVAPITTTTTFTDPSRPSSAQPIKPTLPPISTRPPLSKKHPPPSATVQGPSPSAYTLIRFSTGQILQDGLTLSNYDLSPYELVELHGEHSKSTKKPVFPPRYQQTSQIQQQQQQHYQHQQQDEFKRSSFLPQPHPSPDTPRLNSAVYSPTKSKSGATKLTRHIVSLDRSSVQAYVAPYWEGWVRALRVVNRDDLDVAMRSELLSSAATRKEGRSNSGGGGKSHTPAGMGWGFGGIGGIGGMAGMAPGFGVLLDEDEILKLRDEDFVGVMVSDDPGFMSKRGLSKKQSSTTTQSLHSKSSSKPSKSSKTKSSKSKTSQSKVKLEWKERWVVVQGNTLFVCKDREDVDPTQRISLDELVTIRDKEFLASYPSPATSPFGHDEDHSGRLSIGGTGLGGGGGSDAGVEIMDAFMGTSKRKDKVNDHSKYVICARFRSKSGLSDSLPRHADSGKKKQASEDTKEKGKEKEKSKDTLRISDLFPKNYYNQVAIAAAAGVILPVPSLDEGDYPGSTFGFASSSQKKTEKEKREKREREEREREREKRDKPFQQFTTSGDDEDTTPVVTRPGTGYKHPEQGIDQLDMAHVRHQSPSPTPAPVSAPADKCDPEGQDNHVSETPASTREHLHLQSHLDLPPPSPTTSLSQSQSDVSSPLFAHSSESEWEKAIFGNRERSKQPYHYGYQPAYRWKDTSGYERARDVWSEGVEKGDDNDMKNGIRQQYGKDKQRETEREQGRPYQHEWIILDMGGNSAFISLLRILHRAAPSASSSFKANYLHNNTTSDTGGDPVPSLSKRASGSFSSPTRRGRRRKTSYGDYGDTSPDTDTENDDTYSDQHQFPPSLLSALPRPSPSASNERLGVMPYPEWRARITKRAQRAALGNIGNAMLYYTFRSLDFGEQEGPSLGLPESPTTEGQEKKGKTSKSHASHGSHGSTTTAISTASSKSKSQSDDDDSHLDLLNMVNSDDESSSEMEWHGWILDISRQSQASWRRRESTSCVGGINFHSSEWASTRRAALEPSGTVISTAFPGTDTPTPSPSKSPIDEDRHSGLGPLPSSSSRFIGSPPLLSSPSSHESPFTSSTSTPRKRLASLTSPAQTRVIPVGSHSPHSHALHHSSSMYATLPRLDLRPEPRPDALPPHLLVRRRPSMPHLTLDHHRWRMLMSSDVDLDDTHPISVDTAKRRVISARQQESQQGTSDVFSEGTVRRRASAAGLTSGIAGSLGRSASFLMGGLWRKEKEKEAKDKGKGKELKDGQMNGQEDKKGKGRAKVRVKATAGADGLSGSGSPPPLRGGPTTSSTSAQAHLPRAASGSSLASPNDDDRPPHSPTTGTRRKLKKKAGPDYEVEKIA